MPFFIYENKIFEPRKFGGGTGLFGIAFDFIGNSLFCRSLYFYQSNFIQIFCKYNAFLFIMEITLKKIKDISVTKAFLWWIIFGLGISVLTSKDMNWSFFGDMERMEGYWQYICYFIFFLFLVNFIKTEKQWRWIFFFIVFLSLVIGLLSVWQFVCGTTLSETMVLDPAKCSWAFNVRPDTTIGNPVFQANYLLLAMGFTILLILNLDKFWIFLPIGIFQLFIFYLGKIRSGYLGLAIGVLIYLIMRKFVKK